MPDTVLIIHLVIISVSIIECCYDKYNNNDINKYLSYKYTWLKIRKYKCLKRKFIQ